MNRSGKICLAVVLFAGLLILLAIAFCALEYVESSAAIGVVACIATIPGFYFAFESWSNSEDEKASVKSEAQPQEREEK